MKPDEEKPVPCYLTKKQWTLVDEACEYQEHISAVSERSAQFTEIRKNIKEVLGEEK